MDTGYNAAGDNDLEAIARPFLDLMHKVTGLESTYLTEVSRGRQRILFANNTGAMTIPENFSLDWDDTLCKRAMESGDYTQRNAMDRHLDLPALRDLGIQTYIGVPVVSHEAMVGTLCAASQRDAQVNSDSEVIMGLFASLIAERWESELETRRLSERVELAETRIKDRATYLAAAEHKLKSPVTVIRGWAEELDESWDQLPEDVRRKGISVIAKSAVQLAAQVTSLLEEARSQVVATDLDLGRVDVAAVMEAAVADMSATSSRHQVVADPQSAQWVRADANALWHALLHLVENAIKYSPDGGRVTIRSSDHGNQTFVEVVDDGPGIPDDVDIFEPFVRGKQATTEGSGLGLHVVRTLMRSMGGDVTAERNAGKGSTFRLVLDHV